MFISSNNCNERYVCDLMSDNDKFYEIDFDNIKWCKNEKFQIEWNGNEALNC